VPYFASGPICPDRAAPAVLDVRLAPDPVLSTPATEVDPRDPEVVELAAGLIATMRACAGCVGLAAPQVGVSARLFCLDVGGHRKARSYAGLVVLANPVVVSSAEPQRAREGCLSVPDLTGDVVRAGRIEVAGVVPGSGRPEHYVADTFEARAFQHELDHLDGLLFLDRVAGVAAVHARKRYL
jgi:peptide deformylase